MPLLEMPAKQDLPAGSHGWASECPNFGLIHAATNWIQRYQLTRLRAQRLGENQRHDGRR